METEAHAQLKRLAAAYLLREGFSAVAQEVNAPLMRVRVDVAGFIDAVPVAPGFNHLTYASDPQSSLPFDDSLVKSPRRRCDPRIVIIECKQERADLLRDTDELIPLLDLRDRLRTRRIELESHLVDSGDPGLRVHQHSLFSGVTRAEGASGATEPSGAAAPAGGGDAPIAGIGHHADFSDVQNHDYRRLCARLRKVEQRIHAQTKFVRLARYHAAHRLYVLTFRDLARPRELPSGWGLLECDARPSDLRKKSIVELSEIAIRERHPAPDLHTKAAWTSRWLRAIAAASTRAWVKAE